MENDKKPNNVVDDEMEKWDINLSIDVGEEWSNYRDDEVMQQHNAIQAVEAGKLPYVGDKEPLSALAAEYQSGSPVLLEKIKVLGQNYAAIRRTRGDGNCFFRCFMFSYLEHIMESQDKTEVDRIKENVEQCKKTLQGLGYADFTFEDFFTEENRDLGSLLYEEKEITEHDLEMNYLVNKTIFLQLKPTAIFDTIHDELVSRSRDQSVSDYVVMFFRFVTSGEIRRRSEFFEPFIMGLSNTTVEKFCKASVEPMGEESDHVHITALSDTLGVPIRVMYLDRSSSDSGTVSINHHDFIPAISDPPVATNSDSVSVVEPFITLLYRPGHYDILYPK
ncbi:hypothetical protein GIB67_022879 [Kingdonia uniflora]|uniref:ubiquitinyl hydrolase 1 n=1 Tax=Kingdonia uniflora TaxID=39325 RepID=A0A7J7LAX3_9MAGN|nr:hypothetical protein GIB67_022879 [Kingdonia uniflora]